jgi:NADH dehydrogenase
MAGALSELVSGPLMNDHEHAAKHIKINLIEAGPRLLPTFSAKLSARTKRDLEKMGVEVFLNTAVAKVAPRKISIKDGADIPSEVTIWAAGVRGEPTAEILNLPIIKSRIDTTPTLQVNHYPNIWALGR